MKLDIDDFGHFYNQPVRRIRMQNDHGMVADILELGGILNSLWVPDAEGKAVDVVLGFDDMASYCRDRHYFGALIGRVANRIKGAEFHLDGLSEKVDANAHESCHCVHGGRFGYHRRVWRLIGSEKSSDSVAIVLELKDLDGEEGFRHSVTVTARYELNNDNCLSLTFNASADGPTPINLTAHGYFNLFGHDYGSIAEHQLEIFAQHGLEQGEDRIPTGAVLPLPETDFGLLATTELTDMVNCRQAFNHSYVPDPLSRSRPEKPRKMARLETPVRWLEVWSNELTLHFYNGHNLDGAIGKRQAIYDRFAGLCLEPKGYVNAVNEPSFPVTIIDQAHAYEHRIEYRFNRSPLLR